MRNKISHKFEYREEGEVKHITLEISFVSNRVTREYSELIVRATEVQDAHNRISDIATTMAGEDLTDEETEKLKSEEADLFDFIMEFNENGYFEKRFEILQTLLVDNGYKKDERLMSFDFWDSQVDPIELLKFMSIAIYKDISQKKKLFKK